MWLLLAWIVAVQACLVRLVWWATVPHATGDEISTLAVLERGLVDFLPFCNYCMPLLRVLVRTWTRLGCAVRHKGPKLVQGCLRQGPNGVCSGGLQRHRL